MPEPTPLRLAVAALAVAAVVAGFLVGRVTAPGAKAAPGFTPAQATAAPLALPQLSQAAPLPGYRQPAEPAQPVQPVAPTPLPPLPIAPPPAKKGTKAPKPVRIVGSG